jgi:hypothetical protein
MCFEIHFQNYCKTHFKAVVRHASEALVRDTSEALVRDTSEGVVRHTYAAQCSTQIEHSEVSAVDLTDAQLHLLLAVTAVPLLLIEGCLVFRQIPATTPFSLLGSHLFPLAIPDHLSIFLNDTIVRDWNYTAE